VRDIGQIITGRLRQSRDTSWYRIRWQGDHEKYVRGELALLQSLLRLSAAARPDAMSVMDRKRTSGVPLRMSVFGPICTESNPTLEN
jgi:hypothetical protein